LRETRRKTGIPIIDAIAAFDQLESIIAEDPLRLHLFDCGQHDYSFNCEMSFDRFSCSLEFR